MSLNSLQTRPAALSFFFSAFVIADALDLLSSDGKIKSIFLLEDKQHQWRTYHCQVLPWINWCIVSTIEFCSFDNTLINLSMCFWRIFESDNQMFQLAPNKTISFVSKTKIERHHFYWNENRWDVSNLSQRHRTDSLIISWFQLVMQIELHCFAWRRSAFAAHTLLRASNCERRSTFFSRWLVKHKSLSSAQPIDQTFARTSWLTLISTQHTELSTRQQVFSLISISLFTFSLCPRKFWCCIEKRWALVTLLHCFPSFPSVSQPEDTSTHRRRTTFHQLSNS